MLNENDRKNSLTNTNSNKVSFAIVPILFLASGGTILYLALTNRISIPLANTLTPIALPIILLASLAIFLQLDRRQLQGELDKLQGELDKLQGDLKDKDDNNHTYQLNQLILELKKQKAQARDLSNIAEQNHFISRDDSKEEIKKLISIIDNFSNTIDSLIISIQDSPSIGANITEFKKAKDQIIENIDQNYLELFKCVNSLVQSKKPLTINDNFTISPQLIDQLLGKAPNTNIHSTTSTSPSNHQSHS